MGSDGDVVALGELDEDERCVIICSLCHSKRCTEEAQTVARKQQELQTEKMKEK